ncbi:transmembrane protein 94-like [Brienomyrus brachyistius]|uniref:transmembrane protein 94-like n=1 Tax=Brienomyrus brachyistius TaxID=42636 RepID=UPI0020B28625|nr:transmembrane protein 94-like [Brienomyrus brachyistius]
MWRVICSRFLALSLGSFPGLCHTASLLHSLGSVTVSLQHSQCGSSPSSRPYAPCTEPPPSARVYVCMCALRFCAVWTNKGFCHGPAQTRRRSSSSAGLLVTGLGRSKVNQTLKMLPGGKSCLTSLYSEVSPVELPPRSFPVSQSLLAVLSLSPGGGTDTHVQFDDLHWQLHSCSLGLGAQLASCDPDTAATLCHLTDHLTHVALLKSGPRSQPVCPPWGLYELARILGNWCL